MLTGKYLEKKKKKGFTWECNEKVYRELNLTAVILDTKYQELA